MKTFERDQIERKSAEIWGIVHSDPEYTAYEYLTALGLCMYDESSLAGDPNSPESDLVIAAVMSLRAEHTKMRGSSNNTVPTRRIPC